MGHWFYDSTGMTVGEKVKSPMDCQGYCHYCGSEVALGDMFFSYRGYFFHEDCFRLRKSPQLLADLGIFLERAGGVYGGSVCSYCEELVEEGELVGTIFGKVFHGDCLGCLMENEAYLDLFQVELERV